MRSPSSERNRDAARNANVDEEMIPVDRPSGVIFEVRDGRRVILENSAMIGNVGYNIEVNRNVYNPQQGNPFAGSNDVRQNDDARNNVDDRNIDFFSRDLNMSVTRTASGGSRVQIHGPPPLLQLPTHAQPRRAMNVPRAYVPFSMRGPFDARSTYPVYVSVPRVPLPNPALDDDPTLVMYADRLDMEIDAIVNQEREEGIRDRHGNIDEDAEY